jgi:hypothetical protein
MAADAPRPEGH